MASLRVHVADLICEKRPTIKVKIHILNLIRLGSSTCLLNDNSAWMYNPVILLLDPLGLSRFYQEPSSQTVLSGESARFECQVEGVPTPVITWEKDKVAIPDEAR